MSTQKFVNGLNKMTFIKKEDNTFYTSEGFEVSYELVLLDGLIHKNYPIQFQFHIRKDGVFITRWGCEDNESNAIASAWVIRTSAKMRDLEYDLEDSAKDKALAEFKRLTDES